MFLYLHTKILNQGPCPCLTSTLHWATSLATALVLYSVFNMPGIRYGLASNSASESLTTWWWKVLARTVVILRLHLRKTHFQASLCQQDVTLHCWATPSAEVHLVQSRSRIDTIEFLLCSTIQNESHGSSSYSRNESITQGCKSKEA